MYAYPGANRLNFKSTESKNQVKENQALQAIVQLVIFYKIYSELWKDKLINVAAALEQQLLLKGLGVGEGVCVACSRQLCALPLRVQLNDSRDIKY